MSRCHSPAFRLIAPHLICKNDAHPLAHSDDGDNSDDGKDDYHKLSCFLGFGPISPWISATKPPVSPILETDPITTHQEYPSLPPFTQASAQTGPPPPQSSAAPASFPGIHYDASGRPWFCGPDGTWIGSPHFPNPHASQQAPVPSHSDMSAQSAAQFNFTPQQHSVPPGPGRYPPLIDPSLLPRLPDDDNLDLSDPGTIAKAKLKPANKVGGVRQKGHKDKGKKRQYSSDSDNNSEAERTAKRGRRKGSQNWSKNDTGKLLDYVEKYLPLGQTGWKSVVDAFSKWADASGRPQRDGKAIEAKYKTLLKTKKPTSDAHCPPEIKRAHHIEGLINEKADTREISDDSDVGDASDDSVEVLDRSTVHTAVACRAPTPPPPRRNSRMNAPELVNKLSQAFDPAVLKSRDDERSLRSFQTTQFLALNQQLCDAQAATESLRNELATVQRAHDRAELKLELHQPSFAGFTTSGPRSRARYIADEYPDLVRVGGKIRYGEDSDKENWDPSSSSSVRLSSPFDLASSSSSLLGPLQSAVSVADDQQPINPASDLGASAVDAGPSNVSK
ncbi:hypothetical protein MVEN_00043400 [Mycena venus]|uniref:DUF6818 domain-containing protein n=1 Tax=Mycena venus TaxID=2733690 RepID=A0A8H6Z6I5_9AGAR|nr:hypothetical protein MVEN_00043400 [Mycena venus]